MNFIWLLFAHYIGDIALQSEGVATNKCKTWYVMFSHCMIWTAAICFTLQWLGIYSFWKAIFLLCGHYIIDKLKCKKPSFFTVNEHIFPENWHFVYYDQIAHIIQLLVVFLIR